MFPLFGMALLLLFSPCKVRNFIQSGLDLQHTQVLNKSKSTISNAKCQSLEITTKEDQNASKSLDLALESSYDKPLVFIVGFSNNESLPDYRSISPIPLYILYKKLIVFG